MFFHFNPLILFLGVYPKQILWKYVEKTIYAKNVHYEITYNSKKIGNKKILIRQLWKMMFTKHLQHHRKCLFRNEERRTKKNCVHYNHNSTTWRICRNKKIRICIKMLMATLGGRIMCNFSCLCCFFKFSKMNFYYLHAKNTFYARRNWVILSLR